MNVPPKPNSKWGWRVLRWLLIVLAVLVTLIAAFYTEEDWRGKRAWENYKREMEAKGETFDLQSFAPPAVPDDQNFIHAGCAETSSATCCWINIAGTVA